MATAPKTLTLGDLSGAVRSAVAHLKLPSNTGPYVIINPGIICGILIAEELAELRQAEQIAATIAKQVSTHIGTPVAPVVQQATAAAHGADAFRPNHIIMGYKPEPNTFISFEL
ncbi:hypothetical protein [Granulicella arctica]|uniref:hypothetical protein n=1 Tax=Granulicella arctica TaxID=940613 RepID=UPI0021E0C392|nr:hypothetical protein [Granulicella arctica]